MMRVLHLMAEGARFDDEIHRLLGGHLTGVRMGVYRFKTHEEANRHDDECRVARDRPYCTGGLEMKKESLADMLAKFDPSRHGGEVLPELGVVVDAKPTYEADDGPLSDAQLAQIQKLAESTLPKGKVLRTRSTHMCKGKSGR